MPAENRKKLYAEITHYVTQFFSVRMRIFGRIATQNAKQGDYISQYIVWFVFIATNYRGEKKQNTRKHRAFPWGTGRVIDRKHLTHGLK
jgi:septin family protein